VALHQRAVAAGVTGAAADPWKCVHWAGVQVGARWRGADQAASLRYFFLFFLHCGNGNWY
jgi:hypothetical protein